MANRLADLAFPPKANPANERLAEHLWRHLDEWFACLRVPGLDATNWRAELAIRLGVIYRKVWGGNRTRAGGRRTRGWPPGALCRWRARVQRPTTHQEKRWIGA